MILYIVGLNSVIFFIIVLWVFKSLDIRLNYFAVEKDRLATISMSTYDNGCGFRIVNFYPQTRSTRTR